MSWRHCRKPDQHAGRARTAGSEWRAAWLFFRPIKKQLTLRLDADLIAWFRKRLNGEGYQTGINRALRENVSQHDHK